MVKGDLRGDNIMTTLQCGKMIVVVRWMYDHETVDKKSDAGAEKDRRIRKSRGQLLSCLSRSDRRHDESKVRLDCSCLRDRENLAGIPRNRGCVEETRTTIAGKSRCGNRVTTADCEALHQRSGESWFDESEGWKETLVTMKLARHGKEAGTVVKRGGTQRLLRIRMAGDKRGGLA